MDGIEKDLNQSAGKVAEKINEYRNLVNAMTYDTQAAKDKDLAAINEIEKNWQQYLAISKDVIR